MRLILALSQSLALALCLIATGCVEPSSGAPDDDHLVRSPDLASAADLADPLDDLDEAALKAYTLDQSREAATDSPGRPRPGQAERAVSCSNNVCCVQQSGGELYCCFFFEGETICL